MLIFKKIVLFLVLLILIDWAIGKTLYHYYYNIRSEDIGSMTYTMEKMEAEIVIIGASGAKHNYIPDIIKTKLNLSCFDAGMGGMGLLYYNIILRGILGRYTPKIIILDISPYTFEKQLDDEGRISQLLPYYCINDSIKQYFEKRRKKTNIKMLSKIYPFNSQVLKIITYNLLKINEADFLLQNGYAPLKKILKINDVPLQKDKEITFDNTKINLFIDFIMRTNSVKNIKLIVVSSPYYGTNKTLPFGNQLIDSICRKHDVPFYNFSDDTLFEKHPEYFHNISHLNQAGATVLTNNLVEKLLLKMK